MSHNGGAAFALTPDGLESNFGVNFLAPLLLTVLLLPQLSAGAGARNTGDGPAGGSGGGAGGSGEASSSSSAPGGAAGAAAAVPPAPMELMTEAGARGHARVVWASCSAHYIT